MSANALPRAALAGALLACTFLAGCLITGSSHTETSGQYVSAETVAQITPGKPADFVIALLGEPTSRAQVSDGSEVWKWAYTESRSSSGAVLFLVGSDTQTTRSHTAYVALRGGVVEKAWRD